MSVNEVHSKLAIERLRSVMQRTGLGRSRIYELMDAGEFPSSVPLGGRSKGWVSGEIDSWIRGRIAERDKELAAA